MILRVGDMWTDSHADVILFTGNASVRADGALVMGRGTALEAQTRFPGCNQVFGSLIRHHAATCGGPEGSPYGILIHPELARPMIGVCQVKYRWSDKARLDLIQYSINLLNFRCQFQWRQVSVALNFPGIGFGGLKRRDVLPIIKSLPDNVEVWERPKP